MQKAKCSYCFKVRLCLWRYGTTQCLACALEVISCLLNDLSRDVLALASVASAGDEAPTRPCACGRVGALVGSTCASCAAEELHRRLESVRREMQVLRTCGSCGDTAKYLWQSQLPLCGVCTVTAALCGEPPPRPRS